jgi:hypothetical protein
VSRGGDLIIVPVSAHGTTYRFLLDTGFTCCCFHERYRHLLGEPTRLVCVRVPGGSRMVPQFAAPKMAVGTISLHVGEIACVELDPLENYSGIVIDGILGMDALKNLVVNIDFDEGKVRILDRVIKPPGKSVPIMWHRRERTPEGPFIAANMGSDFPCECLVDTGSITNASGSIDAFWFDLLTHTRRLVPLRALNSVYSLGKSVRVRSGFLRSFTFAGFRHDDVVFERLEFSHSVGIGFLSRYITTLDFPASTAYLAPGKNFARADPVDCGFRLTRTKGEVVVTKVVENGAGHGAGIGVGDVLLAIDGESVADRSTCNLSRSLGYRGDHVVRFRRGGQERNASLSIQTVDRTDYERGSAVKLLFDPP